ncbi:MAG: RimK/LysX family protein [bacterium]|jgi:hypothetical protein|nr:RimK/LysX family protein [bacterium]
MKYHSTHPTGTKSQPRKEKIRIGWTEIIEFPDWGITALEAKVDTGARTSALHVENLQKFTDGTIAFDVIISQKHPVQTVHIRAPLLKIGRIRSSTGRYTTRCFIKTKVKIGPILKEIEISLISREKMTFRMLLGRKAIGRHFLVDVSRRNLLNLRKINTAQP